MEPIVQKHCQVCHVTGGIGPFPLFTYEDARAEAPLMALETGTGVMPPWGAVETPDCTPRFGWKGDARLSADEIATIKAWNDQGAVEGNPSDAPPPVTPAPMGLSGVQLEIAPPAAYTLTDTSTDQFRCYVLDPKLTAMSYVNGTYIVPGNPSIVHHALVFADPSKQSPALVTDQTTNSYDCFGGPGFTNTALVSAWAPGGQPIEYPSDVGQGLAAGTLLVMQVHYHPHSSTANLGPDQTKVQIRWTSGMPAHPAVPVLAGNFDFPVGSPKAPLAGTGLLPGPDDPPSGPAFDIPAGVKGHTETMQFTIPSSQGSAAADAGADASASAPKPLKILAIAGHQHYVGTAVDITINRQNPSAANPASECLLSIPAWNFDWQRLYSYDTSIDQLPTALPGDVVQIKCTYDNTLDNPKLSASLLDRRLSAPVDVKLGETTLDEMCLGAFVFIQ